MNLIDFKGTQKNAGKKLGFVNVKASLFKNRQCSGIRKRENIFPKKRKISKWKTLEFLILNLILVEN